MIRKSCIALFSIFINVSFADSAKIIKILPNFEQYIQKSMQDWNVPGLAIAIVSKDKILYCKGFGTREFGKNKPVDGNTIFQIASLTKTFTAALAGIMEYRGIFKLDDPIKKYIPDFCLSDHEITNQATLHDLITHRMGIGHFVGDSLIKSGFTSKEIIKKISLLPLIQSYRRDYGYSNPFFGLMGTAMENASKQSFSNLFATYIEKSLKLQNTSSGSSLLQKHNSIINKIKSWFGYEANIALNHDKDNNGNIICIGLTPLVYNLEATSGVNSTAHDVGIFMQCLLNNGMHEGVQVIPSSYISTMFSPLVYAQIKPNDMQFPVDVVRNTAYCTGLFQFEYGTQNHYLTVYGHMGGYAGQRTLSLICPNEDFAVIILTNFGHFNLSLMPEALRNKFLDLYLEMPDKDWSKEYSDKYQRYKQKSAFDRDHKRILRIINKKNDNFYLGTYHNTLYGKLTISCDKNGLLLSFNNQSCHMQHFNGDEFDLDAWEFSSNISRSDKHFVEFFPSQNGKVIAYVSFLSEGSNPIFEKE